MTDSINEAFTAARQVAAKLKPARKPDYSIKVDETYRADGRREPEATAVTEPRPAAAPAVTTAQDAHCDSLNDAPVDCNQCGELHSPTSCPWAETCAECSRTDAEMAEPRLCVDCAEELELSAERDRKRDAYEGYGDYMRDQQKDAR